MQKFCKTCNQTKPIEEFGVAAAGKGENHSTRKKTYKGACKECTATYARAWRKKNPGYRGSGKITRFPKEHRLLVSLLSRRMTEAALRQRKATNLVSDLDIDYLYALFHKQNGYCALSGVKMSTKINSMGMISIDKIDPDKWYMKGNIQWVAWAVNRAKGQMSTKMFVDMCKKVIIKCNDYPERE